jgi:hypothetical protein
MMDNLNATCSRANIAEWKHAGMFGHLPTWQGMASHGVH